MLLTPKLLLQSDGARSRLKDRRFDDVVAEVREASQQVVEYETKMPLSAVPRHLRHFPQKAENSALFAEKTAGNVAGVKDDPLLSTQEATKCFVMT